MHARPIWPVHYQMWNQLEWPAQHDRRDEWPAETVECGRSLKRQEMFSRDLTSPRNWPQALSSLPVTTPDAWQVQHRPQSFVVFYFYVQRPGILALGEEMKRGSSPTESEMEPESWKERWDEMIWNYRTTWK